MLPVAAAAASTAVAFAGGGGMSYTNVPTADVKAAGYAPASVLSPDSGKRWSRRVRCASTARKIPSAGTATSTTPRARTTRRCPRWSVLFQGHEVAGTVNGAKESYITRINLDADVAHRVTLLARTDSNGNPIAGIDGSTWDPWAKRLLFTTENSSAPTYAATAQYPSTVTDVSGALGRGGYEGIQHDSAGNIWIVEDVSGPNKSGTTAKQPNSFVYRYVPASPDDLAKGKLQVLQVWDDGHPVTFASQAALNASDQVDLRTYGKTFQTKWVTIHDTATNGDAPFAANTLAKAADGTPFKRPENGQFRPG